MRIIGSDGLECQRRRRRIRARRCFNGRRPSWPGAARMGRKNLDGLSLGRFCRTITNMPQKPNAACGS